MFKVKNLQGKVMSEALRLSGDCLSMFTVFDTTTNNLITPVENKHVKEKAN